MRKGVPAENAVDEAARRLAGRLNALPIVAFGLWSGPVLIVRLRAFGVFRRNSDPLPLAIALGWLVGGLLLASVILLPALLQRYTRGRLTRVQARTHSTGGRFHRGSQPTEGGDASLRSA